MIVIVTSYSVGLASAKVDDCRECTIATCNFSPALLYNFKISRFGGFGGWGRLLSLLFTKFDNPRKGLKTLTFEVLKYGMLITFRTFYRMFQSV